MTVRYIHARAIAHDTPHYPAAVAWLEENGIDPGDVLLDSRIAISDDAISYEGFVRVKGTKQVVDGEIVRKTYAVPKKSNPFPSLLRAIAPVTVPPVPPALNPEAVSTALRLIFSDADYDLHKELDSDDSYPDMARNFISYYTKADY